MEQKIKRRIGKAVLGSGEVVTAHEWWNTPDYHIHLSFHESTNLWQVTVDALNLALSGFGVGPSKRDALQNAIKMLKDEKAKKL